MLSAGTRGAAVRLWQSTLDRLAVRGKPTQPRIVVDGVFGPATTAATMTLQRFGGVAVDGIVGPRTRAAAATAVSSATLGSKSHLKPTLRTGSRGPSVKRWQSTLNRLAAKGKPRRPGLAVDGIFGPATSVATREFQSWAHIALDGIVGLQTYTAAAEALA
jgi:peptidoglycan DL-endopeptidase CwlO